MCSIFVLAFCYSDNNSFWQITMGDSAKLEARLSLGECNKNRFGFIAKQFWPIVLMSNVFWNDGPAADYRAPKCVCVCMCVLEGGEGGEEFVSFHHCTTLFSPSNPSTLTPPPPSPQEHYSFINRLHLKFNFWARGIETCANIASNLLFNGI